MYNIDSLYESGKMPQRYYAQLNGKNAAENYRIAKGSRYNKKDGFIFSLVKSMLAATVKTALDEILKPL
jgi:hypothetical protein